MGGIVSFTATVVCMSVLTVLLEFTVPEGPLKRTVSAAAGMTFLAAVVEQILVIFGEWGR